MKPISSQLLGMMMFLLLLLLLLMILPLEGTRKTGTRNTRPHNKAYNAWQPKKRGGGGKSSTKVAHYDTIVVGAGIVGSGIGYQLVHKYRNKRVLILEQGAEGHKDGSSHGGSRILRHTHTTHDWLPMAKDGYWEWQELQKHVKETIFKVNGVITLDIDHGMTDKRENILKEAEVRYEKLVGSQITEWFPHLQNYAADNWSAIYEPGGVTLLADKCLKAIQAQFKNKGGEIKFKEALEKWKWDEGKGQISVKTSSNHVYTTGNIVFAVGGWLPKLFPKLPVESAFLKGSLYWNVKQDRKKQFFDPDFETETIHGKHKSPSLCIWPSRKDEESMYAIPESIDKFKFCTSNGVKIEEIKPTGMRGNIPPETIEGPKEHIKKHLPWVDVEKGPNKDSETCITTVTKDGKWIVGELPGDYPAKKVYIAGGFCGTGFKYALTVGKLIAQEMAGEIPLLHDGFPATMMDEWSPDPIKRNADNTEQHKHQAMEDN